MFYFVRVYIFNTNISALHGTIMELPKLPIYFVNKRSRYGYRFTEMFSELVPAEDETPLEPIKYSTDVMLAFLDLSLRGYGNDSKKFEKILLPKVDDLSDEKLKEYCKKFVRTNYHPSGTAKMGADNDKMAVLDAKLRVRGIDNLRVCDLSAMPIINSGNTSAPAMMLGLRCGDFILNS